MSDRIRHTSFVIGLPEAERRGQTGGKMRHTLNYIKSIQRVADHGEVFTPAWLVEAMLDLVQDESERIDSRFLEPAPAAHPVHRHR